MMEIAQILANIVKFTPAFPREAVLAARERKDEIVPELLKILEQTASNIDEIIEDNDYMGHIFASFLLAEFREARALPRLIKLLRLPEDKVDHLWSDLLHLVVPRLLASTWGEKILPLEELAEDFTSSSRSRRQALMALEILYLNGELSREVLVKYLQHLLELARTDSRFQDPFFIAEIACIANEIYPEELMLDLAPHFKGDLIEAYHISRAELRATLDRPIEEVLEEARENETNRLPFDAIVEMESWPCYSDSQHGGRRQPTEQEAAERDKFISGFYGGNEADDNGSQSEFGENYDHEDDRGPEPPHDEDSKRKAGEGQPQRPQGRAKAPDGPGRNDPCPCGSGKKFKKCCGNRESLH